jgi:exonuclease III
MDALTQQYNVLSWNVRGLNNAARQEEVKLMINLWKPDLVCLQETKLANLSAATITNTLGSAYENSFIFSPADGTGGGGTSCSQRFCFHAVTTCDL